MVLYCERRHFAGLPAYPPTEKPIHFSLRSTNGFTGDESAIVIALILVTLIPRDFAAPLIAERAAVTERGPIALPADRRSARQRRGE